MRIYLVLHQCLTSKKAEIQDGRWLINALIKQWEDQLEEPGQHRPYTIL
jgi:hypothetical protein